MYILEIEIKAYCDDHSGVVSRLNSMGAEFVGSSKEIDLYFKHPCRDFIETDEALRIRRVDDRNILTYKGAKIGDRTKTRIEEEVCVDDFKTAVSILKLLGFVEAGYVVKDRIKYIFKGIEICIDRVEDLGDFVELEKKDTDRERVEKELFALAEEIGLNRFETRSYLELKFLKRGEIS